jgi:hypothetical protein
MISRPPEVLTAATAGLLLDHSAHALMALSLDLGIQSWNRGAPIHTEARSGPLSDLLARPAPGRAC